MMKNLGGLVFVCLSIIGNFLVLKSIEVKQTFDKSDPTSIQIAASNVGENEEHVLSSLVCILSFLLLDIVFYVWASKSIKRIADDCELTSEMKLKRIDNEDVLFDLPLYAGLFGTVLGFLMIIWGIDISRDVAYVSTVLGIIFSASMRVIILRPQRSKLLDASAKDK